ncbi:hypothetical protein G210_2060, partial [Candida maltosa Xu316]
SPMGIIIIIQVEVGGS